MSALLIAARKIRTPRLPDLACAASTSSSTVTSPWRKKPSIHAVARSIVAPIATSHTVRKALVTRMPSMLTISLSSTSITLHATPGRRTARVPAGRSTQIRKASSASWLSRTLTPYIKAAVSPAKTASSGKIAATACIISPSNSRRDTYHPRAR